MLYEIWENYLLAILIKHLPGDYRVFSPNELGGEWLVANSKREIRPDIVISKKNQVLAVLDAKYKAVNSIGKTAREGVSREDLFQMTSYIYHYGKPGAPLLGLFISPSPGTIDARVDPMTAERQHRIGVLNLDLSQFDNAEASPETGARPFDIVAIQKTERGFVETVLMLLERIQAN
jgi:5-methylcytosine-specific restriction endonuclease McrBC regulatory subunit McrC